MKAKRQIRDLFFIVATFAILGIVVLQFIKSNPKGDLWVESKNTQLTIHINGKEQYDIINPIGLKKSEQISLSNISLINLITFSAQYIDANEARESDMSDQINPLSGFTANLNLYHQDIKETYKFIGSDESKFDLLVNHKFNEKRVASENEIVLLSNSVKAVKEEGSYYKIDTAIYNYDKDNYYYRINNIAIGKGIDKKINMILSTYSKKVMTPYWINAKPFTDNHLKDLEAVYKRYWNILAKAKLNRDPAPLKRFYSHYIRDLKKESVLKQEDIFQLINPFFLISNYELIDFPDLDEFAIESKFEGRLVRLIHKEQKSLSPIVWSDNEENILSFTPYFFITENNEMELALF